MPATKPNKETWKTLRTTTNKKEKESEAMNQQICGWRVESENEQRTERGMFLMSMLWADVSWNSYLRSRSLKD